MSFLGPGQHASLVYKAPIPRFIIMKVWISSPPIHNKLSGLDGEICSLDFRLKLDTDPICNTKSGKRAQYISTWRVKMLTTIYVEL